MHGTRSAEHARAHVRKNAVALAVLVLEARLLDLAFVLAFVCVRWPYAAELHTYAMVFTTW